MLTWGGDVDDNQIFRNQRQLLATELQCWNFEVVLHDIPLSSAAYHDLTAQLLSILTSRDLSQSLFIIYYGGHGAQNRDKDALWHW